MGIRFLAVIVTLGLALWILYKSANANFEPYRTVRLSLWFGGFTFGYTLFWLMMGDTFFDNIVPKLLIGFLGGLIWAFQIASTIEAARERTEKFNSETK